MMLKSHQESYYEPNTPIEKDYLLDMMSKRYLESYYEPNTSIEKDYLLDMLDLIYKESKLFIIPSCL